MKTFIFAIFLLFSNTSQAWVCMNNSFDWPGSVLLTPVWLNAWFHHSGPLPYSEIGDMWSWPVTVPEGMFSVTSNMGGAGNQTVTGNAWCGTDGGTPPPMHVDDVWYAGGSAHWCWCRMTAPNAGQWVLGGFFHNAGYGDFCPWHCQTMCAYCVIGGDWWSGNSETMYCTNRNILR